MGTIIGAIKHLVKTPLTSTGMVNMYIYGGSVISLVTLAYGILAVGTIDGAFRFLGDFYLAKLAPWPLEELLAAATFADFIISHASTIMVGQVVASSKWFSSQVDF